MKAIGADEEGNSAGDLLWLAEAAERGHLPEDLRKIAAVRVRFRLDRAGLDHVHGDAPWARSRAQPRV